jgi:hypothetical protein
MPEGGLSATWGDDAASPAPDWRGYGDRQLPSSREAMEEPFSAFPVGSCASRASGAGKRTARHGGIADRHRGRQQPPRAAHQIDLGPLDHEPAAVVQPE